MTDPFSISEPIGLIEPIDLELDFVRDRQIVALALTGIFNPMGPTLKAIALLRDDDYSHAFVLATSLNPFAQTRQLVARVEDHIDSLCEVLPMLSQGESSLFQCLPNLVLSVAGAPDVKERFDPALWRMLATVTPSEPMSKTVGDYQQHLGDPWARIPSFEDMMGSSRGRAAEGCEPPTEDEWEAWRKVMMDQRHTIPEFQAILQAWSGATQNFGSRLPHMPANEATAELTALGFPFFKQAA